MKTVKYDYAYMFKYSERPKTLAERKFKDDVPDEVKGKRLQEIIELQTAHSKEWNQQEIGSIHKILIEGPSKRSDEHLCGRNGRNAMVVFPKGNLEKGNYTWVKITDCTSATLIGEVVEQP